MMLLYIHDNPIPILNTTYRCSLFVCGNSLIHGFLTFLGRAKAQPETETTVATVAPVAPAPVEAEATKAASELQESRCV